MGDGLNAWLRDHEELKSLFHQYKTLSDKRGQDPSVLESQKQTVAGIIRLLTRHQSAEDRTLYPMFGKVIPEELGGKTLQSHAHLADELGRLMMDWLEQHNEPSKEVEWRLYDETARHLISMVEDHIKDEEEVGYVYLRTHLTRDELTSLDKDYEQAKATAPTHPHPRGPTAPLPSKIAHPVTGMLDRAADKIKEALGRQGGEQAGAPAGAS